MIFYKTMFCTRKYCSIIILLYYIIDIDCIHVNYSLPPGENIIVDNKYYYYYYPTKIIACNNLQCFNVIYLCKNTDCESVD
jgi:hypothetical protein